MENTAVLRRSINIWPSRWSSTTRGLKQGPKRNKFAAVDAKALSRWVTHHVFHPLQRKQCVGQRFQYLDVLGGGLGVAIESL